jgi:hypothetical protein
MAHHRDDDATVVAERVATARRVLPGSWIACVIASGCSAAAVPISQPEQIAPLATAAPLSAFEAIAWSIRDVINLAVPSLLHAPVGELNEQQLIAAGTLTIDGAATEADAASETLSLVVAYDGYEPKINAAVPYTDWRLSSGTLALPALTLDFTDEPAANGLGFIDGTFDGSVLLARAKSQDAADTVDARLSIIGQLKADSAGKIGWQVVHVAGVIHASSGYYYYNDASFPGPR